MRLTYAQRTMNRNVSFEFLNRQLVWHAFTVSSESTMVKYTRPLFGFVQPHDWFHCSHVLAL